MNNCTRCGTDSVLLTAIKYNPDIFVDDTKNLNDDGTPKRILLADNPPLDGFWCRVCISTITEETAFNPEGLADDKGQTITKKLSEAEPRTVKKGRR